VRGIVLCAVLGVTIVSTAAALIVRRHNEAAVDRILIEKSARKLTLLRNDIPLKTYHIAIGWEPIGRKLEEGDGRTPEGLYSIASHKPDSSYHRALRISYPNDADIAQAIERGVSPGGDVMIHGLRNGSGAEELERHNAGDWTAGCIAVTNDEVEEIYRLVPDGTPIEIRP
jgi:murein L,D-transpeptidase YafK